MPTLSPAPPERSAAGAPLLVEALGWKRLRGEALSVMVGGAAYEIAPLAQRAGVHAVHCEARPGTDFPDYSQRLRLRRRVDRDHADALIVFSDAARPAEVWSWRGPGQRGASLREESRQPGSLDARLLWRLAELGGALARRGRVEPPGEPAEAEAVVTALLRHTRRIAPPALARAIAGGEGADPHARLRALVEGAGDPVAVRTLWRALLELRVLDPACGRGEWLLSARHALAAVYEGCLDRMQSWVDDLRRERGPHRRSRLADFRAILERADETRLFPGRAAFAREAALLLNLHGVDGDAAAVAACRKRLLSGTRLPPIICSLRTGEPRGGSIRALGRRSPELAEEVEGVGRAERRVRRMRLEAGLRAAELETALAEIARRRAHLRHALRRGLDGGARTVHLQAEFPVGSGGFHLVRGAGDV